MKYTTHAYLALPGGKVQPHAGEPLAAGVSHGAGPAAEPWYGVVAGHGHVAGVGQVALVQIRAPGAVAAQPRRAGAAAVEGGTVDIEALHALELKEKKNQEKGLKCLVAHDSTLLEQLLDNPRIGKPLASF